MSDDGTQQPPAPPELAGRAEDNAYSRTINRVLEEVLHKAVGDMLTNLQPQIAAGLRGATAKILGFSQGWHGTGQWEIDHCNGRSSIIGDFITREAREMAIREASKIITPELVQQLIQEHKSVIEEEFRREFKRYLRDAVLKQGIDEVGRQAKMIVDDVVGGVMKGVTIPNLKDWKDPRFGADPITGAILAHDVKKGLETEQV